MEGPTGRAGSPVVAAPSPAATALAEMISASRSTVVLTGAGISVPSGIPDFRSPGTGMWENVDPMEVAHIDAWRRDPDRFWSFYGDRFASLWDKRPNPAHEAVAELERRGLVDGVVTQNVDRLHRAAGSVRLTEIHGSIDRSRCLTCGARYALAEVIEKLEARPGAPLCDGCRAPLKPDVVLFGEMLPQAALMEASALASGADLMIVVGSSLTVHPVAGLPDLTLRGGGRLAIVTESATPYDDRAALRSSGDVAVELGAVLAALGPAR